MSTGMVPIQRRRHPLGLPAGSIRSVLMLLVVGMICSLVLISTENRPIRIPPYLIYLFFLMLGSFFAGQSPLTRENEGEHGPLYLPSWTVRLLLIAALAGTIAWQVVNDLAGWEKQYEVSVEAIKQQAFLPLIVLGGFVIGTIIRIITRPIQHYAFYQDLQAWISIVAIVLLVVDFLIELVINPSLTEVNRLKLPKWQGFLAAIVAFYFGVRS